VVQGMGGIMSMTGPVGGPPTRYGVPIGDMGAGMFAAYAVAAALYGRESTGEGQYIDVSMLGGQIALLVYNIGAYFATGRVPQPAGNAHPIIVPYDAFPTADGFVNIAVGNDGLFGKFCAAISIPETGGDPRFATNARRVENRSALYEAINGALASLTTDEVIKRLDEAGVPCGPIATVDKVFENEQVLHTGQKRAINHPNAGEIVLAGFPYEFSDAELAIERAPPMLGEHTREILAEIGYGDAEINRMIDAGSAAEEG
jgi:formyl-CoA transferase